MSSTSRQRASPSSSRSRRSDAASPPDSGACRARGTRAPPPATRPASAHPAGCARRRARTTVRGRGRDESPAATCRSRPARARRPPDSARRAPTALSISRSAARPTKPTTSGASPQDSRRASTLRRAVRGRCGDGLLGVGPALARVRLRQRSARTRRRRTAYGDRGASRKAAAHSACASSALVPSREAAGLRARGDERLQARHAGVVGARFPPLDGADVHADPRRQLALGQADPTAQPQDETTKALAGYVVRRRHAEAFSTAGMRRSSRTRITCTPTGSVVARQPVRQMQPWARRSTGHRTTQNDTERKPVDRPGRPGQSVCDAAEWKRVNRRESPTKEDIMTTRGIRSSGTHRLRHRRDRQTSDSRPCPPPTLLAAA